VNVVHIRIFVKEKRNDHSLFRLHPAAKTLNVQRH
jgi:hypothetical protein